MTDHLGKLIAKHKADPISGEVSFATTGMLGMDFLLGGGLARGRLIEFSGAESTGKSTMGLQAAIFEAQRDGRPGLWLDYEYAWEPQYVLGLGGTEDSSVPSGVAEVMLAQPMFIEDGMALVEAALDDGLVSSVWFDSTGVMTSSEKGLATTARAMAQAVPTLVRAVAGANVVCGMISQMRDVVDTGFGAGYGPKRKATGGRAVKHAFSQRVEFIHIKWLKGRGRTITGDEGDELIGRRVRAKGIKNKVGPPMRECEFDVISGHGFDPVRHLVEMAIDVGVIRKSGSWLSLEPGEFLEDSNVAVAEVKVQGVGGMAALLEDPRAVRLREAVSRVVSETVSARAAYEDDEASDEEEDSGEDEG